MILSDIRACMKHAGRASLNDLAARFEGDKTAIEGMMETLKAHGLVVEAGCGSCGGHKGCSVAGPKIYAWVTRGGLPQNAEGSRRCSPRL